MISEKEKEFYDKEFSRILDYYISENQEKFLISKKTDRDKEQFILCDKEWLMKWKDLRGYDQIKDKLKSYNETKEHSTKEKIKGEVILFFIKRQKEKNIEDIGKMNNKKLLKKDKKGDPTGYFEEEASFETIFESYTTYLKNVMDRTIKVDGEFGKGSLIIRNSLFDKNSEKKIVTFFGNKNSQIQKGIFTFNKDENINEKINEIKKID